MTDEEIIAILPQKEDENCIWKHEYYSELGGAYISFVRQSIAIEPAIFRTMFELDWDRIEKETKCHWGAQCSCSECLEDFFAGFASDKKTGAKGIVLAEGEDGLTYPGWISIDDESATFFQEGFTVTCPICGAEAHLIHAGRSMRNYRTRVSQIEKHSNIGMIITYDLTRQLDPRYPSAFISAEPCNALVADTNGRLKSFSKIRGRWKRRSGFYDPHQVIYHDYDSCCYRKIGGWYRFPKPEFTAGTTLEKSGIEEYIRAGGYHAHIYLKTQKEYPNIENIMKTRYAPVVTAYIDDQVEEGISRSNYPVNHIQTDKLYLRRSKPNEILDLSKADFRALKVRSIEELDLYHFMLAYGLLKNAEEFNNYYAVYGCRSLNTLAKIASFEEVGFKRIINYIVKQTIMGNNAEVIQTYSDYLDMMPSRKLTDEELFPKDLQNKHDELSQMAGKFKNRVEFREFQNIKIEYAGLEWTDGNLCTILPATPEDLINEGEVLRHCVGSYIVKHAGGNNIILFIRHYRRLERNYYTLNVDITNLKKPRRIQLHGYGNERHGEHKEFKHSIPIAVLEFCDRWEKEILKPWCLKRIKTIQSQRKGA